MLTTTFDGAQAAVSMKVTEKVTASPVVTVDGVTVPAWRLDSCEAPLQLAAATGVAAGSSATRNATSDAPSLSFFI